MTRIAFFAHDAGDAAVRRRVRGFVDDDLSVTGFMMRRAEDIPRDWDNIDLGRTHDADYLQRIGAIFSGARRAARQRDRLAAADVIYARNLDMLATAFLARRMAGLKTPVVYECLDVHRLLARKDAVGGLFRLVEGALLKRTRLLVVSSPAFLERHFAVHHPGRYTARLIENRLAAGGHYGPRPGRNPTPSVPRQDNPLAIGWVGVLRCSRSLDLLIGLARHFGDRISISLHGAPALTEIPDFHKRIAGLPNLAYHGRYTAPEDLSQVYDGLDLVWAGDFMEAGENSVWLLPNRLYEGGYYAVPPVAPAGTETANWIAQHAIGFTADEPLDSDLPRLIADLIDNPRPIAARRDRLLGLPDSIFVQPRGELRAVIEDALRADRPAPDSTPASTAHQAT